MFLRRKEKEREIQLSFRLNELLLKREGPRIVATLTMDGSGTDVKNSCTPLEGTKVTLLAWIVRVSSLLIT